MSNNDRTIRAHPLAEKALKAMLEAIPTMHHEMLKATEAGDDDKTKELASGLIWLGEILNLDKFRTRVTEESVFSDASKELFNHIIDDVKELMEDLCENNCQCGCEDDDEA